MVFRKITALIASENQLSSLFFHKIIIISAEVIKI